MSKQVSTARQRIIIKKLLNCSASFKEIKDSLNYETELQDCDFKISRSTFIRDIEDISKVYNMKIPKFK
ncbi:MAG: hypothetical protein WCQ95_00350 [Bacteroidota bacterium]